MTRFAGGIFAGEESGGGGRARLTFGASFAPSLPAAGAGPHARDLKELVASAAS